ncbi:DUF5134 domain-containing protein [Streptomyces boncukensis]|uniref:DUF5134 domain-containing protein n=1 Tax=Streptomyces boncukensis TaxID=2711219 RepID=A0A6G4X4U4_9ACTN|nr:DUF5134 domain-containing protein [Streptomyces boncukensis]NGO72545.1 DUF5134 domain-containing protein [Streptomyces boncukensis]
MAGSLVTGWLLVVVSTATAALCLARASAPDTGRCERRTARTEGAMGAGMALMAAPGLSGGTGVWGAVSLAALFAAIALRSLLFAGGEAHRLHHGIEAGAMVYMAVLMAHAAGTGAHHGHGGHGGHGGAGPPAATLALLAYFAAFVLRTGVRLAPAPAGPPAAAAGAAAGGGRWAPELGTACRLSLALGMVAMLVAL